MEQNLCLGSVESLPWRSLRSFRFPYCESLVLPVPLGVPMFWPQSSTHGAEAKGVSGATSDEDLRAQAIDTHGGVSKATNREFREKSGGRVRRVLKKKPRRRRLGEAKVELRGALEVRLGRRNELLGRFDMTDSNRVISGLVLISYSWWHGRLDLLHVLVYLNTSRHGCFSFKGRINIRFTLVLLVGSHQGGGRDLRQEGHQQARNELRVPMIKYISLSTTSFAVLLLFGLSFTSVSSTEAYDPVDLIGHITIKWDIMNWTPDGLCWGGVLGSFVQEPTNSVAAFQLTVGRAGTTNRTVRLPKDFTLSAPGPDYSCGRATIVKPTRFFTPDLRRMTTAFSCIRLQLSRLQTRAMHLLFNMILQCYGKLSSTTSEIIQRTRHLHRRFRLSTWTWAINWAFAKLNFMVSPSSTTVAIVFLYGRELHRRPLFSSSVAPYQSLLVQNRQEMVNRHSLHNAAEEASIQKEIEASSSSV
ncbi:hypothetical protein ACLB2K_026769 [Fragaria x ananassa]